MYHLHSSLVHESMCVRHFVLFRLARGVRHVGKLATVDSGDALVSHHRGDKATMEIVFGETHIPQRMGGSVSSENIGWDADSMGDTHNPLLRRVYSCHSRSAESISHVANNTALVYVGPIIGGTATTNVQIFCLCYKLSYQEGS